MSLVMFWLFFVLVTGPVAGGPLQCVDLPRILDAVGDGLGFLEDNIDDVIADTLIGTNMLADQLQLLYDNMVATDGLETIAMVIARTRTFTQNAEFPAFSQDPRYFTGLYPMFTKGMWSLDIPVRNLTGLSPAVTRDPVTLSFNETFSDRCMAELYYGDCHMTSDCVHYMTEPGMMGYRLTHQIIYMIIVIQLHCEDSLYSVTVLSAWNVAEELCRRVIKYGHLFHDGNFTVNDSGVRYPRDLFQEQVAVCGILSFCEVAERDWLNAILSWQHLNGCFGSDPLQEPEMQKRRGKILQDGCDLHTCAVALAALGAMAKFLTVDSWVSCHGQLPPLPAC